MISSDRNDVVGKSARACDSCVKNRARWYCGADDAFLCQSCDSSVHSANPLACRHQRVRLKCHDDEPHSENRASSSWHRRKPRTPRRKKPASDEGASGISNPLRVVPELEISGEEENENEVEEQLLYRVPVFDPYVADQLCSSGSNHAFGSGSGLDLPSEMDLAEFAADVESLLGKGLDDDESFDMEGLGILDCDERVKVEEEYDQFIGLNFDYGSPIMGELMEDDDKEKLTVAKMDLEDSDNGKKILLRLDYQGVMSAWDDHKSPWMTGKRPDDVVSDQCWPHCMGTCGTLHAHGEMGMMSGDGAAAMVEGGREARVSRYREKRRRRLFSKKIRYEVRKLNAEKRPRMKGRFVKKANLVAFT